ncbi:GNAT family N-acetyltransferase [Chitinophaga polysaccharea]|uniref:GNAT family N-acetyltransferase n=1 Tax=Chitinophaga TaxID=79328 RepID=UPI00145514CC|nr:MULTISPECIES: GNAT family N-acetyltransferase [Chitinophaga]NLR58276.1 GNAT family N-acetyltransferase [Chitinophaga polysaccharea]NLU90802.1 GNAT family N-acetyltransferase [Chitinophaga sp. Ak27]
MEFTLQPVLENEQVILLPLEETDFPAVYAVASDPKVWEQHPNKDRWQHDIFRTFFEGAIQSKGAFKIVEKATGQVIGSTRYYDFDATASGVAIGYTFYGTAYWGTGINPGVKKLMLDHAFQFVDQVYFHIGVNNIRSQVAIGRLGAKNIATQEVNYYGEPPKLNFLYRIGKEEWAARK